MYTYLTTLSTLSQCHFFADIFSTFRKFNSSELVHIYVRSYDFSMWQLLIPLIQGPSRLVWVQLDCFTALSARGHGGIETVGGL